MTSLNVDIGTDFILNDLFQKNSLPFNTEGLSIIGINNLRSIIDLAGHSKKIVEIWQSILQRAASKNLLKLFDEEVLSRLKDPALFATESTVQILERIFESTESVIMFFLELATTFRSEYYSTAQLRSILEGFDRFMQAMKKLHLPTLSHRAPCYDQGGKELLDKATESLRTSIVPGIILERLSSNTFFSQDVQSKNTKLSQLQVASSKQLNLTNEQLFFSEKQASSKVFSQIFKKPEAFSVKKHQDLHQALEIAKDEGIFYTNDCSNHFKIIDYLIQESSHEKVEALIQWFKATKQILHAESFTCITNPECYREHATFLQVIRMLQILVRTSDGDIRIPDLLRSFFKREISLPTLIHHIENVKKDIESKKFAEKDMQEVLKSFSGLSETELHEIAEDYKKITEIGHDLGANKVGDLASHIEKIKERCRENPIEKSDKLAIIAIVREALRLKFGIYPYTIQVLALLILLNHPSHFKGRIAQVMTGEGKSTITTMLAFYHACLGRTVDMISSSRYLAKRDYKKYHKFFQDFGIAVSHMCTEMPTAKNFEGQIIFGTNFDFEFALMRDYMHESLLRTILADGKRVRRPFSVVIVDEVDNLFIDSALSSARIAIQGKMTLHWIYPLILSFVKQNKNEVEKFSCFKSSSKETDEMTAFLRNELLKTAEENVHGIIQGIKKRKLELWLSSAYSALYKQVKDEDYVVKPIEEKFSVRKNHNDQIVIVDKKNTGRLQEACRWQHGLHEFLEALHNLPIKDESLTPLSISHPVFMKLYSYVYGLTGSSGSDVERKEIETIYNTDIVEVPRNKPNLRVTYDAKIHSSQESYFAEILLDINEMKKQERPTLILFETIKETEDFALYVKDKDVNYQVLNERQSEHEDFVIARAGMPGIVTLATNTAGRGTDIVLHPESLKHGGLHVVFGFYPQNDRVEQQGFGRAGRQGQPGSSRIIIYVNDALLQQLSECFGMKLEAKSVNLDCLQTMRSIITEKLSRDRLEKTQIELINFQYLQPFLDQMAVWQKELDKVFISDLSFTLKINSQPIETELSENEAQLSKLFESQVEELSLNKQSLELYLKTVRKHLETKILQDWAEYFYEELDEIYRSTKERKGFETTNDFYDVYRKEVEFLHEGVKAHWEESLLKPKDGFLNFLEKITGISI